MKIFKIHKSTSLSVGACITRPGLPVTVCKLANGSPAVEASAAVWNSLLECLDGRDKNSERMDVWQIFLQNR